MTPRETATLERAQGHDPLQRAIEYSAQLAAKIVAVERELPIQEVRAKLYLGLSEVGGENESSPFSDAPAKAQQLRDELSAKESRREALAVTIDHLRALDFHRKAASLSPRIDDLASEIAAFPDADRLRRLESSIANRRVAERNGLMTSRGEGLMVTAKDLAAINELRALESELGQLQNQAAGYNAERAKIREKYGDLGRVVVGE